MDVSVAGSYQVSSQNDLASIRNSFAPPPRLQLLDQNGRSTANSIVPVGSTQEAVAHLKLVG